MIQNAAQEAVERNIQPIKDKIDVKIERKDNRIEITVNKKTQ